ncbi:uncharacterized protein B0T15DRAFT_257712 [Chaetomium strumarium]|uniref:Uncharacterized protein n=1 Tax=Chaetomium strumarium TaxID=1170767 RepID=A0AAJ0GMR4_9PEZI|nr:hypothetical protein B0T15DRAFT_257712 [Chaetomium strumarium]
MDPRTAEVPSKRARIFNRANNIIFCLLAVLFCSAVLLNLWATTNAFGNYPLERLVTTGPVRFEAELFSTSVYNGQPRKELVEDSIPLRETDQDPDLDHYPLMDGQRRTPSHTSASSMCFMVFLAFVLGSILCAAMSILLIPRLAKQKMDVESDRHCAMRMAHYCELALVQNPPFSSSRRRRY